MIHVGRPTLEKSMLRLKAWQMKLCAFWIGAATTGTKAELATAIADQQGRLRPVTSTRARILSIDMGIRNLAYCVLDVRGPLKDQFEVVDWRRLDLIHDLSSRQNPEVNPSERSDGGDVHGELLLNQKSTSSSKLTINTLYSPANLSRTALALTTSLLSHQPDTILIERQRFRSGGAPTVQEWTLRVNMLESMMWACLRTLDIARTTQQSWNAYEVSPARVASFWFAPKAFGWHPAPGVLLGARPIVSKDDIPARVDSRKVEKKDKIRLVQSWLRQEGPVRLNLQHDTKALASGFSGDRRQAKKLDDLADCLLQAIAWSYWEQNSKVLSDTILAQ